MKKYLFTPVLCWLLFNCQPDKHYIDSGVKENPIYSFSTPITELTDADYPDNPDIGFRHNRYGDFSYDSLVVSVLGGKSFNFTLLPKNAGSDTIFFTNVNLLAFMPVIPNQLCQDEYLKLIGIVNQEWNRHQVRFETADSKFRFSSFNSFESKNVTRIDIARNCLNSGLWEIIAYAKNDGGEVLPYYHAWFDFPLDVYAVIFNQLNPCLSFQDYKEHLVNWKDPERKRIDLLKLRNVKDSTVKCQIVALNDKYYKETGARKKKKKNIIFPKSVSMIQDFLTDSTAFSTFSPPGYYNTKDPRRTSLGALYNFKEGKVRKVSSTYTQHKNLKEIELTFKDKFETQETKIIFGGLDFTKFPVLLDSLNREGYKYPMGIANHSFYETYSEALNNTTTNNPYYGFILDEENIWTDSHYFGIDGPLFFWDAQVKNRLHLYLLSFERHAYVGHFTFDFEDEER